MGGRLTVLFLLLLWFSLPFFHPSAAAEDKASSSPADHTVYTELAQSVQDSIRSESGTLKPLHTQLDKAEASGEEFQEELADWRTQLSVHENMLHLPAGRPEDLRRILGIHTATLALVSDRYQDMEDKLTTVAEQVNSTEEQLGLIRNQEADLRSKSLGKDVKNDLLKSLNQLRGLVEKKLAVLKKLSDIYAHREKRLKDLRAGFEKLQTKYEERINEEKQEGLFHRSNGPLQKAGRSMLMEELEGLGAQLLKSPEDFFRFRQISILWRTETTLHTVFLLVFCVSLILVIRLQKRIHDGLEDPKFDALPWTRMALEILCRSFWLLAALLLLYAYAQWQELYESVPFIYSLIQGGGAWLATGWLIAFSKRLRRQSEPESPAARKASIRPLAYVVRVFAIAYMAAKAGIGGSGILLPWIRLAFDAMLLTGIYRFMGIWRKPPDFVKEIPTFFLRTAKLCALLGYFAVSIAILLDLGGYGTLATFWLVSWGRSFVVVFWACLAVVMLREADVAFHQKMSEVSEDTSQARPLGWLVIRISWAGWFAALVVGLLFAWGARRAVFFGLLSALTYPVSIGKLHFTLLSIGFALVVLLITHTATRLWRQILQDRLLADSGLKLGIRESIATVTVYAFWVFGILFALNVVGFSSTSLFVGFGALGIGLGFGLQTIFNNFVSGLILLLERPIQVGDAVELNGTWGVVKKINVRSTLVQTWDNASLIIPNSEFITNQVVNWSYRDMRLRRHINVGVAYGSDVELVRKTLIEAAENHSRVLASPQPDVLFTDFGDSALNFRLRFWTTVEYSLSTETDIRFEINRLFAERDISIPFPQRDLHIRSGSLSPESGAERKKGEENQHIGESNSTDPPTK